MIYERIIPFLIILFLFGLSLWVRFRPLRINPALGVDHWYWLLCIEEVKKSRRIPPRLPYFMLEMDEQWYPPLYSIIMSLLPMKVLKEKGGQIAQAMDLLNGMLIFISVLWVSDNPMMASLSGFSYMVAFLPLTYNNQLQPRGIANFILTLAVLGVWGYVHSGNWVFWGGVLVLSVGLLFLHKMTVQMWVVYVLGLSLWARDWTVLMLLPASVFVAMLISKGFYLKVLKAHWDIVTFWHENIRNLGSHQYYESPRYRVEHFISTATHQPGLRALGAKGISLFQFNAFILILPALLHSLALSSPAPLESFSGAGLG